MDSLEFKRYTQQTITSPILLARQLSEIGENGFSIDNEEHQHGVCCLASTRINIECRGESQWQMLN